MDITGIFNSIGDFIYQIIETILSLFPDSPFVAVANMGSVQQALGWLNWVIPISSMIAIMETWLTAVGIYYLWQALGRWLGVID